MTDRVREALEPFAKAADNYADYRDDARFVDNDATITVGNLRNARQAFVALASEAEVSESARELSETDLAEISMALGQTFADENATRLYRIIVAQNDSRQQPAAEGEHLKIGGSVCVSPNFKHSSDWLGWTGYISGICVDNETSRISYEVSDTWPPTEKHGRTDGFYAEDLTYAPSPQKTEG